MGMSIAEDFIAVCPQFRPAFPTSTFLPITRCLGCISHLRLVKKKNQNNGPRLPAETAWSLIHPVNICVPRLCQSLWLGHTLLPHCGSDNGRLFSDAEESPAGHVEGRKRKRGQRAVLEQELAPDSVLKPVVCLWGWVPLGPESMTIAPQCSPNLLLCLSPQR